jgi:hypothetical protein
VEATCNGADQAGDRGRGKRFEERIAAKLSLPSTDKGPGAGASGDQRQARDIVHAVDHAERRCADGRENSEAKYRDGRHTPCGYERRARGCTWHGAVAHLMHDCLDGQDLAHVYA